MDSEVHQDRGKRGSSVSSGEKVDMPELGQRKWVYVEETKGVVTLSAALDIEARKAVALSLFLGSRYLWHKKTDISAIYPVLCACVSVCVSVCSVCSLCYSIALVSSR